MIRRGEGVGEAADRYDVLRNPSYVDMRRPGCMSAGYETPGKYPKYEICGGYLISVGKECVTA